MGNSTEDAQFDGTIDKQSRLVVLRDVIVFQFKLAMDGIRDLLLSPVSIVAAIAGFIIGGHQPGKYFYSLLKIGHKSDAWINLFGASEKPGTHDIEPTDVYIRKIEDLIVQEYEKGGLLRDVKDRFDKLLDQIDKSRR